jgi:hypothetical protein
MREILAIEHYDRLGNPVTETIGEHGVLEIKEHTARGEGDKFFYDIIYKSGYMTRVFYPCHVWFNKKSEEL